MQDVLRVEEVCFSYDEKPLLHNLTFSVSQGEVVALVGRSGCGKTTLFRMLAGLEVPTKGVIKRNFATGYMMQHSLLLPWRTVLANVLLPFELGKNRSCPKEQALALLQEVGLSGYEYAYPSELSGGMQSRVSLARVLLEDRPILLLDEPFAYLDALTRKEMQTLLQKQQERRHKTIILVTHDLQEALFMSDRILVLSQGSIIHTAPSLSYSEEQLLHVLTNG